MIKGPFTIKSSGESIQIHTADRCVCAYIYYDEDPGRRDRKKRLTKEDAIEAAKIMARALTEAIGPKL